MIPRDRVAREREQATQVSTNKVCVVQDTCARETNRDNVGTDAEFQRAGPDENVNESTIANDMKNSKAITANGARLPSIYGIRACACARARFQFAFVSNQLSINRGITCNETVGLRV